MNRVAVILLALIAGGGVALFAYITTRGFSAREKPSALEAFLAHKVRGLATPAGAKTLRNPLTPTALSIAEGRDHFADHCAICHANDGSGKTVINAGLYPPAPDLRGEGTRALTDGELLYTIKNGIRFTGMPGWGGDDEENWKLVIFIRHLPNLSEKEQALMKEINGLESAGEHGEDAHEHRAD